MFEGDNSWSNKPPPAEYEAGPKNPWAKCAGKGKGKGPGKTDGLPKFKPPKPKPQPTPHDPGFVVDEVMWELGTKMRACCSKLAAVMGSAISTQAKGEFDGFIPDGVSDTVIDAIKSTGSVSDGAMIGGIDPPVPNYAERVAPPALNLNGLRLAKTEAQKSMVTAFANLVQAAMGEVEIIDRARSAGQADDAEAYHNQVGDLFMVQEIKNREMVTAAKSLKAVVEESHLFWSQVTIPNGTPMREMVQPIYIYRPSLEKAGYSASDLNAALFHLRIPSPLLTACEEYVQASIEEHNGDAVAILFELVEELLSLDFIDLAPFDEPPQR